MGASDCFTKRTVILPNAALVRAHISQGQSGRDLVDALYAGDADRVLTLLKNDPRLASAQVTYDPAKTTERPQGQYGDLLTIAVSRCDLDMVATLLAAGLPADGVQVGEPLTLALLADGPEMAELLLRSGAAPDPQKKGGKNAMFEATAFGNLGAVMTLLRHGLDTAWEDEFGNGHLQTAVDMEQFRIAELLIDKGANPWRIGGAGNMAAQSFDRPLIRPNAEEDAARLRLGVKARAQSAAAGVDWPPPNFVTVRTKVLAGEWPTPAMKSLGAVPLTPIAMADMKRRFGQ
jgi:hypothetical protein